MIFFIEILNRFGLLKFFNFSIKNNQGFIIPVRSGVGIEMLIESEPWMMNLLNKTSGKFKNKVFVDVGVNVGQTLTKVFAIHDRQHYIGFEPNPSCVKYLDVLLKRNNFISARIIPAALSTQAGSLDLEFYTSSKTDSSASIIPAFRKEHFSKVKVNTLNGHDFDFQDKVGMIKIDVEGSELEVLSSLEKVINRDRPFICCEILPPYTAENTTRVERQQAIEKFLIRNQFGIIRLLPDGSCLFISDFGIYNNINFSNYLFYPLEERDQVEQLLTKNE